MYNLRKTNGGSGKEVKFEVKEEYKDWEKAPQRIKKIGLCKDGGYEVEKILQKMKKEDGSFQYLVKWKNWSSSFNSWEPKENLNGCSGLVAAFELEKKLADDICGNNSKKNSDEVLKVVSGDTFSNLEDVLQLLGKKEEFSSTDLSKVHPTCIYGFPVIDGVQGIRLSWEDRLIETIPLQAAMSRWPKEIQELYASKPRNFYAYKLEFN